MKRLKVQKKNSIKKVQKLKFLQSKIRFLIILQKNKILH